MQADKTPGADAKRSLVTGILLGIGTMAAVDEIVFHQILAWHHFFDWSTPTFGLLSDGLLHAAELIIFVLGFFMYGDLRGRRALSSMHASAGFFFGMGGFQLFDGVVNHKLLGLHQIRYVENTLPYDVAWNGFAVCLLVIAYLILRRARAARSPATSSRAR
ncbi:MAG TPA: DUF2243 domain-containing protein [Burkholderiaceae bacterium]|nr:DUF2243 domain-containing protein [Burkholderiaceae bacterium]